jgi:diphosphomevalonate decarboxylase
VAHTNQRLDICRRALLERDFEAFAEIVELDSNLMHAVMMTSNPPLFYWEPESLSVMKSVKKWRASGLEACYTLDAGPNVHVICRSGAVDAVVTRLKDLPGVQQVLTARPGGPAQLV